MRAPFICLICLTGCVNTPDSYEIPEQHPTIYQPRAVGDSVRAEDPRAEAYFLKDVKGLEGPDWRWTGAEPEFRFDSSDPGEKRFQIEFTVHERTFKDTGPVSIEFYVNGNLLSRETYAADGRKVFQKTVPREWLRPSENRVVMKILNPWEAPDPGVLLGVLFHSAGLVNQ